jgi:hypothetical protein
VLLMLSINSALLLILSVTVGPEVAIWITAGALGWFALWWYAVPLWSRIKHSAVIGSENQSATTDWRQTDQPQAE